MQTGRNSGHPKRWQEMLGGEMPETVELLKELKEWGLRLYALTNWSHETFPIVRCRFGFLDWFDGNVVSGEEQLVKPAPAIFHRLLARYDIEPACTVYIDDSPRNVSAAAGLGFHALQFVDAHRLRQNLTALGLPVHQAQ